MNRTAIPATPQRRKLMTLAGLLCALWASIGLAQVPAPAPDTTGQATPQVAHFGFYASAMGHWNFTAELAPHTTLTWVHVYGGDRPIEGAQQLVERVREAREHGVQAVLSLEPFLFADARGTPRPADDIEAFLVELRARLELEGLMDSVLMLYPKDEPFREFRRARDPNFIEQYVTGEVYEDIHADLEQVLDHLASIFPEKPRGVILSGLELHHRFFAIPKGYDWVGFNCYDNLFRACEDRSFVQLYGRLLAHMTAEQRLIAVPEAWAMHESAARDDWPEVLARRLAHHWEMIMSEPRFVAVIPFLWSFDAPAATPGIGLDRFGEKWDPRSAGAGSAFRDTVLALGEAIKHGETRYPNLAWSDTEAHPARSGALELGEIIDIGNDGRVTVQALDHALLHKNLRVQLVLYDAGGRRLLASPLARTHVPVAIRVRDEPDFGLLLGTHGYAWQIPTSFLGAYAGQTLTLELNTYADGPELLLAHSTRQSFEAMAVVEWPFRFDALWFHPDLWNPDYEQLGPVFRP